ncbi:MAG: hypothetical protein AAFY41_12655, partial [Bacteroidota bacterium]
VADPYRGSEILLGMEANSLNEIQEMEKKISKSGGKNFYPLQSTSDGLWVLGFSDPDGHRWRVIFTDYELLVK